MKNLKSPPHKLLAVFQRGRDSWKKKYAEVKAKLTLAEHQVRAVERSRAMWRARAEQSEALLAGAGPATMEDGKKKPSP